MKAVGSSLRNETRLRRTHGLVPMAPTPYQVLKPLADYNITFRQQHRPSSQRLAISSVVTKLLIRTFLIYFNSSVNRIVDVKPLVFRPPGLSQHQPRVYSIELFL